MLKTNHKKTFFYMLNNKTLKKVFFIFLGIVSSYLLLSFTFSANVAYLEEVKSVEISSSGWSDNEDERTGGSWHIDKSAEWTGERKAQITFSLETTGMLEDGSVPSIDGIDAIFVLDNSGSMSGTRITQLKTDANALINELLTDSNNRAALINFNTSATLLSSFTNNKTTLQTQINNLKATGLTSYEAAYKQVDTLLNSYTRDDRRVLVMIFLTDGYPTSKNHRAQYPYLKQKYPYMIINAIQYELGHAILAEVIAMSDYQYLANRSNLYEVLFTAYSNAAGSIKPNYVEYENFVITDYISEDFHVESKDDITVSIGTVDLVEENGKQKVIWYITDDTFKTGSEATMSIDVTYVGDPNNRKYVPTNDKEEITYKLPNEEENTKISEETPVLQAGYDVTYELNLPEDCKQYSFQIPPKETYVPYTTVTKSELKLECENYVFRGWEPSDDNSKDIKDINENQFTMPAHDVVLKGTWGTLDISKTMQGEVKGKGGYPFDVSTAVLDTGIDFKLYSSDTNGKGLYIYEGTENDEYPIYYYRGAVTNNNIIFANFCWKIVRTTETGGTKLIYNGVVGTGNTCNNTGTASQLSSTSAFNSTYNNVKYMGYTYDYNATTNKSTDSTIKGVIDTWYKTNIEDKGYSGYLEDTIWCTDRNESKVSGNYTYYGFGMRSFLNKEKPIVTCPLQEDSHTVDSANGNGLLTYPIALLTGDEAQLAGYAWYADNGSKYSTDPYIYTGQYFWLLSPNRWDSSISNAFVTTVSSYGSLGNPAVYNSNGVRPSVSLLSGTSVTTVGNAGEEGSVENPYIVE